MSYAAPTSPIPHPPRRQRRFAGTARRAAALYAVGALVWISASDPLVSALDIDTTLVNIAKGYLFVAATTLLLWAAFRRHEDQVADMITDLEGAARARIEAWKAPAAPSAR